MSGKKRHYYYYVSIRALILSLGFLCFFILLHKTTTTTSSSSWFQDSKFAEVVMQGGRKEVKVDPNLDINKRRIPSGPDPIHNRRAGNSGRPPGQA